MYRRPLPATNLRSLSAVMWDARESSPQTGTQKIAPDTNPADLLDDLEHQALAATIGHAQGTTPLSPQQQQAIVAFEMSLTTAQLYDYRAGALNANGATGGPMLIGTQTLPGFYVGSTILSAETRAGSLSHRRFPAFDAWMPAQIQKATMREKTAKVRRGAPVSARPSGLQLQADPNRWSRGTERRLGSRRYTGRMRHRPRYAQYR